MHWSRTWRRPKPTWRRCAFRMRARARVRVCVCACACLHVKENTNAKACARVLTRLLNKSRPLLTPRRPARWKGRRQASSRSCLPLPSLCVHALFSFLPLLRVLQAAQSRTRPSDHMHAEDLATLHTRIAELQSALEASETRAAHREVRWALSQSFSKALLGGGGGGPLIHTSIYTCARARARKPPLSRLCSRRLTSAAAS
jgi:hypothetical protein